MMNITYRSASAVTADAPADGREYVRKNGHWVIASAPTTPVQGPSSGVFELPGGPVELVPEGPLTLTVAAGASGTLRVPRGLSHVTLGLGLAWKTPPDWRSTAVLASYGPSPLDAGSRLYVVDEASDPVGLIRQVGEVVALFDAEPARVFTDAGTTTVTGDGDPVREVHCAHGSGVVLTASGAGITYRTDGTRHWLESDGTARLEASAPAAWVASLTLAVAAQEDEIDPALQALTLAHPSEYYSMNLLLLKEAATSGLMTRSGVDEFSGIAHLSKASPHVLMGVVDAATGSGWARIDNGAAQPATGTIWPGSDPQNLALFGEAGGTPSTGAGRIYGAVIALGVPSTAAQDTIATGLGIMAGLKV